MILRVASGFRHLLRVVLFARGQKVAYIQTDRTASSRRPSPSMDLPLMRFKRYCVQSLSWERIVSAMLAAAFTLVLGLTPTSQVAGQVLIPAESLPQEAGWQEVLQRGYELEAQQRWGEALAHYEGALRDFPDQRDLWERLSRARSHFDLARRYEDQSYLLSIRSLDEAKALALYEEILAKIESHYVSPPNWQQLAERGLANLDIALAHAVFRRQNSIQADDQMIQAFQDNIHRRMEVTVVQTRQQAREVASNVARAAAQQLNLAPTATILEFTCGATSSLDQYSSFLTSNQLKDVFCQIEGNFVGLGIELRSQKRSLEILSVISGSPAAQAGLRAGDRITQVDGIATDQMSTDEAADLLKGAEGSWTELHLMDGEGAVRQVRLMRRRVEVPSIEKVHMADPELGIAYIKVSSFQKTTSRDIDAALWKLHQQGMQTLVIDLRGNPGGLLNAAVEVADKFVTSGNIVSTRGRNSHEDFDYRAHSLGTWRVPLLVLIDNDTASASEIFAGAIRDHRRGTVVGQRSYGKGSVQGIFTLNTADLGVRLTTARFYSPSGQPISQRGISPDLIVQTTRKPMLDNPSSPPDEVDVVLQSAVQHVRNQQQARQPHVSAR
jgi:carboxyl-terminal processing protease